MSTVTLILMAVGLCPTYAEPKLELGSAVTVKHTSNLYNLSDEKEDLIDVENGAGERFYGMQGPEDVLFIVGGDAALRWKLNKKRYAKVFVGAKGVYHQDNDIADYERVKAGASVDITRKDNLKLSTYAVGSRFKKNYKVSKDVFEHAFYDEDGLRLRYLRKINKDWVAGIAVSEADRTFNAPFSPRNRSTDEVVVYTEYEVVKGITLGLGAGQLEAQSGIETIVKNKYSYARDRSYDQEQWDVSLSAKCPAGWTTGVGALFTTKEYTSSEALDALYFDREDDIVKYAASLTKKVSDNVAVVLTASKAKKTSNRVDDGDESEVNYETTTFGGGIEITF
jgi:hypothetical protein